MLILPVVVAVSVVWAIGAWKSVEGSAGPADVLGALTYATACRNSLITLLTGVPFERALFYHKIFAVMATVYACYHGYIALVWPEEDDRRLAEVPIDKWTWSHLTGNDENLTGLLVPVGWAVAILVAFVWIRRKLFEVFYRLHVIAAIFALIVAAMHGASITVMGGAVWVLDMCLWVVASFCGLNKAETFQATACLLPADVVRVSLPKGRFKYKGGQYCNLCVPGYSMEWHPFSFSSSPHEDQVRIHIRVLGNWTRGLQAHLMKRQAANPETGKEMPLKVLLDGPYGAVGVDIDGPTYKSFLLVSGGIGITPMQSIWGELLNHYARGRPLGVLRFVWSVADKAMVKSVGESVAEVPDGYLPLSFQPPSKPMPDTQGKAKAEFYLTRVRENEREAAGIDPKVQQHVVFGKRPDLDAILAELRTECSAAGESRVAVLACGPGQMMKSLRSACAKHSGNGIQFDCHTEVFEF